MKCVPTAPWPTLQPSPPVPDDMKFKHPRVCLRSCRTMILRKSTRKQLCSQELQDRSRNQHLLRFSEIVKQFSKRKTIHSPELGTRPCHPHRFEYSKLMTEFKQAGQVDQVLRLMQEMKDFNLWPDVVCYTIVMDSLVMVNRTEQALDVFKEMIFAAIIPDTACCTVLVKLYSVCLKQFDSAYEVILWMKNCGCFPDTFTYTTLIVGLCWDGRVEEAFGVLDYMLEDGCLPNVYTYTPIVNAYCSMGKLSQAKNLVKTMESTGCLPNNVTYNILIKAFCKIGALDEVEKLLEESQGNGWKPDEISYSTYMDGLCKLGKIDCSFQQLDIMLDKGLVPNEITVNILLDCLCSCSMAWETKCLLERSAELEWEVDVINYNTVMSRLCDDGRYRAVLKLFTDMIKKSIAANSWTLSILVHSLCRDGKPQKARCLLDSEGLVANVVAYTILIQYYYLAGKAPEVSILFSKMVKANITPNFVTYGILIDCFCGEGNYGQAVYCFLRSLEQGLSQELGARLTYWLVSGGRIRLVQYIIEHISKHDIVVDYCIYYSIIKESCKMGYCQRAEFYIVCGILDKMLC
ncbi:hypothetical protein KSP40_PGU003242 [Platanthera guangdongensis]|uniref:Pentatricopeptide repeat-containing protein n=1 Tax=Platanthera guangdongensis TaxID=2320717 RepID=A0ABR2MGQ1_9ASPA